MGYQEGWAALNLEPTACVPRVEYSAENHWELIKAVTGIDVGVHSPDAVKVRARTAFMKAWDYCLIWRTFGGVSSCFRGRTTKMGHAVYAAGGVDYSDVIECPFRTPEEVLAFDPMEEYGSFDRALLVRQIEAEYEQCRAGYPDAVSMSGMYFTMFSGLIHIFGWDMFLLAGGLDPVGMGQMCLRYEKWISQFYDALAASSVPVMMAHDDITWTSGPVFAPAWYREYIFPAYRRLWRPLLDAGKRLLFTSDGDYTVFFDDIVAAGAHVLVMEPMSDMALFAEKYGKTHGFIGNADTRILLSGTRPRIRAEVERCMSIGKKHPGFIMAVGNHMPSNTPVENALYYNDVYNELKRR